MDFPILWVKIDRGKVTDPVVLSTGSTLIIKDSRFSLRQDIDSSSFTLQVHVNTLTNINFLSFYNIIYLKNSMNFYLVEFLF